MLSVSATVPQPMRANLTNASPSPPSLGRKDRRSWNCEYSFPKRRWRPSSARKKIISANHEEEPTIGLDVHCQPVHFDSKALEDGSLDFFDSEQLSSSVEASVPQNSPEKTKCFPPNIESTPRPIPFLKSAHMQRPKAIRAREEDEESSDCVKQPEKFAKKEETSEKPSLQFEVHLEAPSASQESFEEASKSCEEKPNLKIEEKIENSSLSPCSVKKEDEKTVFGLGSRMSRAVELLQTRSQQMNEECLEEGVEEGPPGIPGEGIEPISLPPVMEDNGWESDAEMTMLRNFKEEIDSRQEVRDFHEEENSSRTEVPYFMIGFPNPPGENRCWLNATLHAMFALPIFEQPEQLDSEMLRGCSQLTKTLMALRVFWSKGMENKQKTYQTVKLFKESLGIIDESYPSYRQQDVSEFLTMFLNYLKTDFEGVTSRGLAEESENVPENLQESRGVPRSPQTPTKRPPLADISPGKRRPSEKLDFLGHFSPKSRKSQHLTYSSQDLSSPRVNRILSRPTDPSYKVHTPPHHRPESLGNRSKESHEAIRNPIDRNFLLHMMEHYSCKGCGKHRQRKVDNLMLYADLPSGSENRRSVSLAEAIRASLEPEERVLTCGKCNYDKHKVFTTFRLPPKILMVQVNRYGMSEDGSVAKFNTPVEIPEDFELQLGSTELENSCSQKQNYEPVCVIAHVGSAMDCGHYTSYVRRGEDSWYHYNDLSVTPMTRSEALTAAQSTAYVVLFVSTSL